MLARPSRRPLPAHRAAVALLLGAAPVAGARLLCPHLRPPVARGARSSPQAGVPDLYAPAVHQAVGAYRAACRLRGVRPSGRVITALMYGACRAVAARPAAPRQRPR